jgi:hypothetical protein
MIKNKWNFCCSDCFENIARNTNTTTAKMWMDLCAQYLNLEGCFEFEVDDYEAVRNLEQKGFIVTTDTAAGNLVRVNGLGYDFNEQVVFCLEREKHRYV